ncbi:unnamed protein product, partial [Prorocentrum cordatum]
MGGRPGCSPIASVQRLDAGGRLYNQPRGNPCIPAKRARPPPFGWGRELDCRDGPAAKPGGILDASDGNWVDAQVSSPRPAPDLDTLLVEVRASEEALLGYRQGAEGLELVVRAPLMLAAAAQVPHAPNVVCVTLPTAE